MTRSEVSVAKLNDETVEEDFYLENVLNSSGGFLMAVGARTRINWMKFQEYGKVLHGRRFLFWIKGKEYQFCVRSEILSRNETWCLDERKVKLLRKTERAMRVMCGVKLFD